MCLKPTEVENAFEEKLNLIKTSIENEFKIQIANLDNQLSKLRAELHAREINESIRNGMNFYLSQLPTWPKWLRHNKSGLQENFDPLLCAIEPASCYENYFSSPETDFSKHKSDQIRRYPCQFDSKIP